MKKLIPFIILLLPLLVQAQYEQHEFVLKTDSSLQFDENRQYDFQQLNLIAGEKLVFAWRIRHGGEPGNGSACETLLVWEVDRKAKKFALQGESLRQAKASYWQKCFSADRGFSWPQSGYIRGEMDKDGSWQLDLNLTCKGHNTGKTYRFERVESIKVER